MKLAILFLFFYCISVNAISQTPQEKTFVYNLTLDTLINPDYYTVSISVSEYLKYERITKKDVRTYLVPLDTLTDKMLKHLSELGIKGQIQKSSISEVDEQNDSYYRRSEKKLFKATFSFTLNRKDSIEYLFANIDRSAISGMIITPEVYETTIERIKQFLIPKGMKTTDKYAAEIAEKMNQRIEKSKYAINFYDGGPNSNFNDFNKKYFIDFKPINYRLSISYTYTMTEK